ncbi:MAG: DedA family protein [Ignavibacteriales bacterium]|nr:DedA family protein [Ignavibacteriales bacterium]
MRNSLKQILLRCNAWLETTAEQPRALWALFGMAFIEASLFPLSVDVPLVALGTAAPRRAFRFALAVTAGSFAGGYLGYYIGAEFYVVVGKPLFVSLGMIDKVERVLRMYHQHGIGTLMVAGFIPLPYITFTITAGFQKTIDLWMLTMGALVGRSLRFLPIGLVLYYRGREAKRYLECDGGGCRNCRWQAIGQERLCLHHDE